MKQCQVVTNVVVDDGMQTLSFLEVCRTYHMTEADLAEWLSHGLLSQVTGPIETVFFNSAMINRVQAARRLQRDLGVNIPGVILALELRDALDSMRAEIDVLRRHLSEFGSS